MNQKKIIWASVAMTCILLGSIIVKYEIPMMASDNDEQSTHGTSGTKGIFLELLCDLPTERPTMSTIAVQCPTINNPSQAQSYASQYFSQFSTTTFEESYSGKFIGLKDNEMVEVFSSGTIVYSFIIDDEIVSIDSFPISEAEEYSESFIIAYGGMEGYEEFSSEAIRSIDDNDEPTGMIKGYFFVYHKTYEQYLIYGADCIQTEVYPSHDVVHYYRGDYILGLPLESQQVISAETAWNAVTNGSVKEYDDDYYIEITDVTLCYYIKDHKLFIDRMYPCWRFEGEGAIFYVNAFSGVPM